jgi:hypothetical protein
MSVGPRTSRSRCSEPSLPWLGSSTSSIRHGLRHTALTWMAEAGIDLHILQRVAVSAWWSVVGPERPALGVIEGGKNAVECNSD